MTNLQIQYAEHRENVRHNLAGEQEVKRHNLAWEGETNRHNVATEYETHRHNVVGENIGWHQAESARIHANAAASQAHTAYLNYQENVRHNVADESIKKQGNWLNFGGRVVPKLNFGKGTAVGYAAGKALSRKGSKHVKGVYTDPEGMKTTSFGSSVHASNLATVTAGGAFVGGAYAVGAALHPNGVNEKQLATAKSRRR